MVMVHQEPERSARFAGGVRRGWRHATDPLAAVEIGPHGVRVITKWRHLAFVETWEASLRDLVEVQALGRPEGPVTGVGFRRSSDDNVTVVWTDNAEAILAAVRTWGVPVNASPTCFHVLRGRW